MNTQAAATVSSCELQRQRDARREPLPAPVVDVVLPVHNEERVLADSVRELHRRMRATFDFAFVLTIADNASSDATRAIGERLARELPEVQLLRIGQPGRGNALRVAWQESSAQVVAYMDVDLSTDLAHLRALLVPLIERRGDITIGSRLTPGARVSRGIKRELISRSYNILLRAALGVGFSDAQCGFKAARRELIVPLLGRVRDDGWFFDTELLYLAQRSRLSIREIPVRWVDDPDSRVHIVSTALADLRGVVRLRREARTADVRPPADPARVLYRRPRAARVRASAQ
jgi:glycosyltransferase involved in cell wall biosynthesis